jgi:erythromycin esterase
MAQAVELMSADALFPDQFIIRDRFMAENIEWILEREGAGSRIAVWAHNGHVATSSGNYMEWMGSHLRRMYGPQLVVFGFAFNQGEFQAIELEKGLRVFHVAPAPEGSLDAVLAASGLKVAAIDLRGLPQEGPRRKVVRRTQDDARRGRYLQRVRRRGLLQ